MKNFHLFKKLAKMPMNLVNNFELQLVNLTTLSEDVYNLLSSQFFTVDDLLIDIKYGAGALVYKGRGTSNEYKICGSRTKGTEKTYLVHSQQPTTCNILNTIVKGNSENLHECKIASSEGVFGISLASVANIDVLLENAMTENQNLKKRIKISQTSNRVIEIGGSSTSKFFQICIVPGLTNPQERYLLIVSKIKETSPKFLKMLDLANLGLEDFHALALRDIFTSLNDCELKSLVLHFLKTVFSLPSEENLKSKTKKLANPKIKYINGAFQSVLKYLKDPSLKVEIQTITEKFIDDYTSKK